MLVLRDGLRSALVGVIVGLFGAAATARWISHLLYDVDALDPIAFAGAGGAAVIVSLVSAYLPSRRVARIDPRITMTED